MPNLKWQSDLEKTTRIAVEEIKMKNKDRSSLCISAGAAAKMMTRSGMD